MTLYVQYMDVGQGDSTLILFPNGQTMLIDCGTIQADEALIKTGGPVIAAIKDFFKGIKKAPIFDVLVLTHADRDHYNLIGTLAASGISFKSILHGGAMSEYINGGAATTAVLDKLTANNPDSVGSLEPKALQAAFSAGAYSAKKAVDMGDKCELWFLAANAKGMKYHDKNAASVAILVSYLGHKLYFMGDGTRATEKWILTQCAAIKPSPLAHVAAKKLCLLKAGHHGSETSSCPDWLDAINPNMVMISADAATFGSNGTGMPSEAKIEQFKALKLGTLVDKNNKHDVMMYKSDGAHKGYFETEGVGQQAVCTILAKGHVVAADAVDMSDDDSSVGAETLQKLLAARYKTVGIVGTSWSIEIDAGGFAVLWSGVKASQSYSSSTFFSAETLTPAGAAE